MEVRARAPGKIIVAGEHAVVHGSTAVAASIDLYTQAAFRLSPDVDDGLVQLELKDLSLEFSWTSRRLREAFGGLGSTTVSETPRTCSTECLNVISSLVEELRISADKLGLASGTSAFLFLYTSIQGFKSGKMVLTSGLPLGAGLGSSASFCVSISAALLSLSGAVSINGEQRGWFVPADKDLDLVNKWAFEGERIIHGKPSGIDNTVSTFGSMIKFRKGDITRLQSCWPLRMLITNTKVGRNTKSLVAGVSERTARNPDVMAAVFKAVDSISNEISSIIESPASDNLSEASIDEKIAEMMEINQGLLQCMGVSHLSIETVVKTTRSYKLTSKLTGAGGGGCVLTLLPSSLSSAIVNKVVSELEGEGFQCFEAQVGGNGLEISRA